MLSRRPCQVCIILNLIACISLPYAVQEGGCSPQRFLLPGSPHIPLPEYIVAMSP